MKLKTLKDLEVFEDNNPMWNAANKHFEQVIKAEAINDITYMLACDSIPRVVLGFKRDVKPVQAVINYIKWKNNITSEDLK